MSIRIWGYKDFSYTRFFLPMLILVVLTTSCIKEGLNECVNIVRVVPTSQNSSNSDWIGEGTLENVMLYVFNENQVLLDVFSTEAGKEEHLSYPHTKKLYVASTANTGDDVLLTAMIPGVTTLSQVEIALKEKEQYLDFDCFNNPPDIFFGLIEIPNTGTDKVVDLPIYRKVAATMIRVRGLKEHLATLDSSDDDYTIILETQYKTIRFDGALTTKANPISVAHKQTGGFRIAEIDGREYFESPKQVSSVKTDFFQLLSSDTGTPVSINIYYKGQLVPETPVTVDSFGNPLQVKNDQLNVIEIYFGKSNITIRVKEAAWNGVVEIEKDFGPGDDW